MRRESAYQKDLVNRLGVIFPGCFIIKTSPDDTQGIPDLLILFGDKWAMLEVKRSPNEDVQPNQAYYIHEFNRMAFAAFIFPENEEEVLYALQSAFGLVR